MFIVDQLILVGAILILLGIFSSKLSARLGLPVLVLFLLIGMLAGEDGLGGIMFDSPDIAHALGSLALAIILFDGGLQTPVTAIRQVWKPSAALATVGVLVTALIVGVAASFILPITLLEGLLIGSIVGSTDAAAVFSLLRNAGIHLSARVKSTLEVESASNDPMAIFLTVALLQVLVNDMPFGIELGVLFVQQMGLGTIVGLAVGYALTKVINKINLQASGLYPVLVTAGGLLSFGIAANIGGSGFLAIFITGVIIGNHKFAFQKTTFLFHDGLAWLSQIMMFVVLGLLLTPSGLLDVWWQGLAIACVLMFIARPIAVIPLAKLFGFNPREITLLSWVGLRGSVPIILAIYPLIFGLPNANLVFNVVFFVVLLSATLQGWSLPWVARKLGLIEPPPVSAPVTLEITSLGNVDAEIIEFTLSETSKAANRQLSQMALPDGVVIAMITRNEQVVLPRGATVLRSGDHLFVICKHEFKPLLELAFAEQGYDVAGPLANLNLKGSSRLSEIIRSYNLDLGLEIEEDLTLEQLFNKESVAIEKGSELQIGRALLSIENEANGRILTVTIQRQETDGSISETEATS